LSWLIGAVLIGAVVPFTFIGIMPTNRRLLSAEPGASETRQLLRKWNLLHAVRTILSPAALMIMVSHLIGDTSRRVTLRLLVGETLPTTDLEGTSDQGSCSQSRGMMLVDFGASRDGSPDALRALHAQIATARAPLISGSRAKPE
jgi:hypothetical protein